MSDDQAAVRVTEFSCRYGADGPLRLERLSLEVGAGEFVAIVGPSGGGKSSLAYAINGIVPHEIEGSETAGEIRVLDVRVSDHQPHDLVRVVGTVLQDPEWQLVTFTVGDELAFALENLGVAPAEIRRRVGAAARLLGLETLLERSPDELSGGQKQRVAIASCLALEAPVLLLDEPMAELDPAGKRGLIEAVTSLHREHGITVLFIDHNLDLVAPIADRVVVMANARIVAQGKPADILADPAILETTRLRPPQSVEVAALLPPALRPTSPPLSMADLAGALQPRAVSSLDAGSVAQVNCVEPSDQILARTEAVWYRYPDGTEAVRGISLSIGQGEYIGLIGANGAGKSTLARLLVGLLRPTGGTVLLGDDSVAQLDRLEVARRIGYVFQNPDYQFFSKTCFEEVAFGLRLRELPEEEVRERVSAVLHQLEISAYADEHPHFLSRGQRRRVALASVLVLEPEIIVLDEPTTGLDTGTADRMLGVVRALHARGHTIVLLTHEMRAVLEHCTRLVLVHQGQVVLDGDPRRAFHERATLEACHVQIPPLAELVQALPWRSRPLLPRTTQEAATLLRTALEAPVGGVAT